VAFLEANVAKWRANTRTLWRVEHPKVASAIVALAEAVRSNHQLSSKVGSVLAKLLCTRLDSDELFKHCKDLQEEKKNLANKSLRRSCSFIRKRLWSNMKKGFKKTSDRSGSSPRTST